MSIADKLVYLIRQGTITIERVAPQYRDVVEAAVLPAQKEVSK